MKNYIHIYKNNKEIAVVNNINETKKYKDADYCLYEFKKDYRINKHSKAYLYPTDYKQLINQIKKLYNILSVRCNKYQFIDFNDVNGNGIDVSISIDGNTYQYIKSINFPVNNDTINTIIKEWNDYVR